MSRFGNECMLHELGYNVFGDNRLSREEEKECAMSIKYVENRKSPYMCVYMFVCVIVGVDV